MKLKYQHCAYFGKTCVSKQNWMLYHNLKVETTNDFGRPMTLRGSFSVGYLCLQLVHIIHGLIASDLSILPS